MTKPLELFQGAMRARGIIPPENIIADGRIHRADTEGKNGKNDASYLLHLDGVPAGGYENFKDGQGWQNWHFDTGQALTATEKRNYRERIAAIQREQEIDEAKRHEDAARKAADIIKTSKEAKADHPYLVRKHIKPCPRLKQGYWGQRGKADCLLVLMQDIAGKVLNVQAIFSERDDTLGRDKDFLWGARKKGLYFPIGDEVKGILCIAEGLATALSIHEATSYPVAVSFDCRNLEPVALALRAKFPEVKIIMCGDDDRYTPENPGRTKATAAAAAICGHVVFPIFRDDSSGTDFNDMLIEAGPEAIRERVEQALIEGPTTAIDMNPSVTSTDEVIGKSGNYFQKSTGIFSKMGEGGNSQTRQLTNFAAKIVSNVRHDDGQAVTSNYLVWGVCEGRTYETSVPAERFESLSWVRAFGPRALVYPGNLNRDYSRAAIQLMSEKISDETIFTHTGWRQLEGTWVYLHAGGAIGPAGQVETIHVALPSGLEHFILPAPPEGEDCCESIRRSMRFLELAPDSITFPLYSLPWRAVFNPCPFSVHISGFTGVGKTEMAALIQQHFGPGMNAKNLPAGWDSTGNFLTERMFHLKNSLVAVDDFAPGGNIGDVTRYNLQAERVFRSAGNLTGRGRLNADATMKQSRPPRGTILSTGEDVPRAQSIRARLLVVDCPTGAVKWERLTGCQKDALAGWYAKAMAAFIRWVASNYEIRFQKIEDLASKYRPLFAGEHKRTADSISSLAAGFRNFLDFVVEVEAVTVVESEALWSRAWEAFMKLAQSQASYIQAADPIRRFFDLLNAAVSSGRAYFTTLAGDAPDDPLSWGWRIASNAQGPYPPKYEPRGNLIGWLDGQDVFIDPDSAYKVAQDMSDSERISLSPHTLWSRMQERGLIVSSTPGKGSRLRKRIGDKSPYVIHLHKKTLEGGVYVEKGEQREHFDNALINNDIQLFPGGTSGEQTGNTEGNKPQPVPFPVPQSSPPKTEKGTDNTLIDIEKPPFVPFVPQKNTIHMAGSDSVNGNQLAANQIPDSTWVFLKTEMEDWPEIRLRNILENSKADSRQREHARALLKKRSGEEVRHAL